MHPATASRLEVRFHLPPALAVRNKSNKSPQLYTPRFQPVKELLRAWSGILHDIVLKSAGQHAANFSPEYNSPTLPSISAPVPGQLLPMPVSLGKRSRIADNSL